MFTDLIRWIVSILLLHGKNINIIVNTNTTITIIIILSCDATGGVGSDRQFHAGSDLVSIAMNKKTL